MCGLRHVAVAGDRSMPTKAEVCQQGTRTYCHGTKGNGYSDVGVPWSQYVNSFPHRSGSIPGEQRVFGASATNYASQLPDNMTSHLMTIHPCQTPRGLLADNSS